LGSNNTGVFAPRYTCTFPGEELALVEEANARELQYIRTFNRLPHTIITESVSSEADLVSYSWGDSQTLHQQPQLDPGELTDYEVPLVLEPNTPNFLPRKNVEDLDQTEEPESFFLTPTKPYVFSSARALGAVTGERFRRGWSVAIIERDNETLFGLDRSDPVATDGNYVPSAGTTPAYWINGGITSITHRVTVKTLEEPDGAPFWFGEDKQTNHPIWIGKVSFYLESTTKTVIEYDNPPLPGSLLETGRAETIAFLNEYVFGFTGDPQHFQPNRSRFLPSGSQPVNNNLFNPFNQEWGTDPYLTGNLISGFWYPLFFLSHSDSTIQSTISYYYYPDAVSGNLDIDPDPRSDEDYVNEWRNEAGDPNGIFEWGAVPKDTQFGIPPYPPRPTDFWAESLTDVIDTEPRFEYRIRSDQWFNQFFVDPEVPEKAPLFTLFTVDFETSNFLTP
jgi:hypothetical protein